MLCSCCAAEDATTTEHCNPSTDEAPGRTPGIDIVGSDGMPKKADDFQVREFTFSVVRANKGVPLGLLLDPSGSDGIYVCSVQAGDHPIANTNKDLPDSRRLKQGDFIFKINDVSSDLANMMTELQAKGNLEFVVRRPISFEIQIDRKDQSVGCGITYDASTGISLVIESINEGPIQTWNAEHPDKVVRIGDRIVAVNGTTGNSAQLLDVIRGTNVLDFRFVRMAEP
mmetsp:Transcript_8832/g.16641  ORF Transcript_8832/g.16641 Transcript_8832/m.16641 type:complete len:227 (-) Transcript_8832:110-790(-)